MVSEAELNLPTFANESLLHAHALASQILVAARCCHCHWVLSFSCSLIRDTRRAQRKNPSRAWVTSSHLETSCKSSVGEWKFYPLRQLPRQEIGVWSTAVAFADAAVADTVMNPCYQLSMDLGGLERENSLLTIDLRTDFDRERCQLRSAPCAADQTGSHRLEQLKVSRVDGVVSINLYPCRMLCCRSLIQQFSCSFLMLSFR